jgi:hypothetical protein
MQIDKELIKTLRNELQLAVDRVCARHGLNAEQQKNITYNEDSFNIRFTISNGEVDLNKKTFDANCFAFGLSPNHYGETFRNNGKIHTIVGINTRARKYPIETSADDGKGYKFDPLTVRNRLRDSGKM